MARRTSSRVSKRSSSRNTRSRSALSAAASGSGGGAVLERMVREAASDPLQTEEDADDLMEVDAESDGGVRLEEAENAYEGKGKGKLAALLEKEHKGWIEGQPFRLFDLPTEIRLEIYRACLTRPGNILLSKDPKPAPAADDEDEEESEEDTRDPQVLARLRAAWDQPSRGNRPPARRRAGNGGAARTMLRAASSGTGAAPIIPAPNAPILPPTAAETAATMPTATFMGDTASRRPAKKARATQTSRTTSQEPPLIVNLLRTSKTVYKEARDVLYGENAFNLDIFTAVSSLAALHQRSRRRIKHVELEVPTYTEILESFSETVRLSLRYCFGLRKLVIHTPFTLPGADGQGAGGNTTVYANGFDILRWLPQGCEVVMTGKTNVEIDAVVRRHRELAGRQDMTEWQKRQFVTFEDLGDRAVNKATKAVCTPPWRAEIAHRV